MIAIPAVDLRQGACVQLVGGDPAAESIRLDDAVGAARRWQDVGFTRLHVVDLDAALGIGDNRPLLREVMAGTSLPTQVGGGLRSTEDVDSVLADGAAAVIVGTRAIEDQEWLEALAWKHIGRILVALDARERKVVVRGWADQLGVDVIEALRRLAAMPLAGVLVTAVHREGQMRGPDTKLLEAVVAASALPVYGAGGITTMDDLRRLDQGGLHGVVIGMALYTGTLDPRTVAEEFGGGSK